MVLKPNHQPHGAPENRRRCKHFQMITKKVCRAGVTYLDVIQKPTSGEGILLPCFSDHGISTCDKCEFPSDQEIADSELEFARIIAAIENDVSPCCNAPLDDSRMVRLGSRGMHGHRYCSQCGKLAVTV